MDVNAMNSMKLIKIKKYEPKIPEIESVKVTEEAFKKMNLYASMVSEIIGEDKECMGTLLNYKTMEDNVTRDVYLWKNQVVTSTSGMPGDYIDKDVEAKKRDMTVTGLWHSHGGIGVFHSSDDNIFLKNMYQDITNKVFNNERRKSIECIVEGETVRLLDEGGNKEIKIKGKIDDIECVERDGYHVLNSIVINKNSYLGCYRNPELHHDYDAEVWIGYDKTNDAEKKVKHVNLELIDEINNIQLDEEELVKEVGEKVIFQGSYLRDLPNYQRVLEKYKSKVGEEQDIENNVDDVGQEQNGDLIEQIVKEIPELEDKKKVSLENILPAQKVSGNGYYKKVNDFYSVKKTDKDRIISTIGLLGEILAGDYHENGKRYWLWKDRVEKAEGVYKGIKRNVCKEQRLMLGNLLEILNTNYYARRKHGEKLVKMCKKMGFKKKVKVKKSPSFFSRIFRRRKR